MLEKEVLGNLGRASSLTVKTILTDPRIGLEARFGFACQVLLSSGDNGIIEWIKGPVPGYLNRQMKTFIELNKQQIFTATLQGNKYNWLELLKFIAPPGRSGRYISDTPSYYIGHWVSLLDVADERMWSKVQDLLRETYSNYSLHEWLDSTDMTPVLNHPYIKNNPYVLPPELFGYFKGLELGRAQTTPEAAAKKLIDCPEIINHAIESMTQTESSKYIPAITDALENATELDAEAHVQSAVVNPLDL